MDLHTVFDSQPPLEDLKSKVREYLQSKKAGLNATNDRLKAVERELASKEASRKMNL